MSGPVLPGIGVGFRAGPSLGARLRRLLVVTRWFVGADTSTLERRRALAAAIAGDRRQAFAALAPWVDAHPDDQDAAFLLVLALYELKTIDKNADAATQFDARAKQYVARGGPRQALVARWLK